MKQRTLEFRAWHNTANKYLESGSSRQVFSWIDEGQDITIEQFTGLLDKNGTKIYEGDIVNAGTEKFPLIMTIEFVNASFCQCNEQGNWIIHSHDKFEVIGNIYENPELTTNNQ